METKTERSELTLAAILDTSLAMAAADGLDSLTIGEVAKRLGLSKSGVFSRVGSRMAGVNTSCRNRRPYSSMTALCSASREPTRENTPLLDRPMRSATTCSEIASSPCAAARSSAAPTIVARVSSLFCVRASMAPD
jgi:AcrR family transcriptional regulator